jgi:hypothetical protein
MKLGELTWRDYDPYGAAINDRLEWFLEVMAHKGMAYAEPIDGGEGNRWQCPVCNHDRMLEINPGDDGPPVIIHCHDACGCTPKRNGRQDISKVLSELEVTQRQFNNWVVSASEWPMSNERTARQLGEPSTNGKVPNKWSSARIEWEAFWNEERDDADWLAEPLLANTRSHLLYARRETGKSELALFVVARLATGRDAFRDQAIEPLNVVYLDLEMTANDLWDRLSDMGYGGRKLPHLHYYLLPELPPLDTPKGGAAILEIANDHKASLVVIDTIGRVVEGEEDRNDTYLNVYKYTGLALKRAGIAYMRLDHPGKDPTKEMRGASAKGDDVDVIWEQSRTLGNGVTLKKKKRRMSWVPETINLERNDNYGIVTYALAEDSYLLGTDAVAKNLDDLGAPVDISRRKACDLLRENGLGVRTQLVTEAIRYRKDQDKAVPADSGTTFGGPREPPAGTTHAATL